MEHQLFLNGIGVPHFRNTCTVIIKVVCIRPELDVQLKSFHHEDHQMKTNWPASVSVRVNNYQLEINRGVDGKGQRPVYLKHVCQPGQNMLQIAVTNCCCVSRCWRLHTWVREWSFMSRLTHNRSFRRRVFPGNHLHWYWQHKTNGRKYTRNTKNWL